MWFAVRRLRQRGVAISRAQRQFVPALYGDLRIEDQRVDSLGRLARVATLYPLDRQIGDALLPSLLDAQLLWMSPLALVLGGCELEADAAFVQSWHCTPIDPFAHSKQRGQLGDRTHPPAVQPAG